MADYVMVDIEDGHMSPETCISRVIHTMRDMTPNVYTPKIVSIGPFHYGNERLQDMERHKQVLFKRFTQRSNTNVDVLISFVENSVPKVRASYSENINLSDREFVKLILVDAAFIIELFFSLCHDLGRNILTYDAKLSQPLIIGTLPLDLVLFENQLPFFVFEELFNIAFPLGLRDDCLTFRKLACKFFCEAFDLEEPKHDPNNNVMSVKHFTDLLRFLLLQRAAPKMEQLDFKSDVLLHGAKGLQELGVKFKVSKSKSLLDIKFSGHVLELPWFLVADLMTEASFYNMIAFEQHHCLHTPYITNYVTLWTFLFKTKEDVHVLADNKVIDSLIPYTEVVALFRIMTKHAFQGMMISEYIDIFKSLNKFCESGLRQSRASLRRDYCKTPWQTVASFAGIIVLILTILQTIFSILQVIKEK